MVGLVLGNHDYWRHTTDEGDQLQKGLAEAGWIVAGRRFEIDEVDVGKILALVNPGVVFVQDPRDWDTASSGCFDRSVCFENVDALRGHPAVYTVVKDAGSLIAYQQKFAERIGACGIVHYYHERSVTAAAPWLSGYRLIRTYHSVDRSVCDEIDAEAPRRRGAVSGAVSGVYPLRGRTFAAAGSLGIDALRHPGYGDRGSHTPRYLQFLSQYKTHVATASRYGFALRKIIESVAMGCTPITDLPAYDELPEIDGALVRVSSDVSMQRLREVIDEAEAAWNLEAALHWAEKARAAYDYRALGRRLGEKLSLPVAA